MVSHLLDMKEVPWDGHMSVDGGVYDKDESILYLPHHFHSVSFLQGQVHSRSQGVDICMQQSTMAWDIGSRRKASWQMQIKSTLI